MPRSATVPEQQAALRRVALLVARGAAPADVFAAIAREVAELAEPRQVQIHRWERDGTVTVMGTWGDGPNSLPVLVGVTDDLRTGRPVSGKRAVDSTAAAGAPVLVEGETWGHIGVAMAEGKPLPDGILEYLAGFTELVATAISSSETRARLARLVDEQAALRRVATLIARGAPAADVFEAVVTELGRLLEVGSAGLLRFDSLETATVLASWGRLGEVVPVGSQLPLGGQNVVSQIARTGRSARMENYAPTASGPIADQAKRLHTRTAVGGPIMVAGRLWGAMIAASLDDEEIPADTTPRLEQFTELASTAIANAEARAQIQRLADEQAALRRVATLVAKAAAPSEVFDAAVVEVARLLGATQVGLMRALGPNEIVVVAHLGQDPDLVHAGMRFPLDGDSATRRVLRSGRSARIHLSGEPSGAISLNAQRSNAVATVGAPVTVEGRLWGVITASWERHDLAPADAEERLTEFASLLDTAIANADARDQLTASRARVLTAGDDARRRVVRDLHDGAQQRFVHAIITLKLAQRALPATPEKAETLVADALQHAERGNHELRELAHGILPAALTRGGLAAGVRSLVSRLQLDVRVDVRTPRLPSEIEASAYFIVAEGLTNVVKHAQATSAEVTAAVTEHALHVEVSDDGIGGADPSGPGLLGIGDRAAALGGRLDVSSAPGGGTRLTVELPLSL